MEATERPRPELEARLQSAGAARVLDQDRIGESGTAMQGEYFRDTDVEGFSVLGGGQGPGPEREGESETVG